MILRFIFSFSFLGYGAFFIFRLAGDMLQQGPYSIAVLGAAGIVPVLIGLVILSGFFVKAKQPDGKESKVRLFGLLLEVLTLAVSFFVFLGGFIFMILGAYYLLFDSGSASRPYLAYFLLFGLLPILFSVVLFGRLVLADAKNN